MLLLMLINLLLQISTNPHLSFVSTSFHSPPFNLNRNSHQWLLLIGGITLAVEKQDDSQGHTVCYFPDRKETKAYNGSKKSKHNSYKERWGKILYWDVGLEIFFFWEYLDLMIRILSGIRNIKDIGNPHIWVISNVCSFQMYSEGFCNFH